MKALPTTTSVAVAAALALGVGPATVTKDAQAAWKPKKPVELVIMAGKGGDADRLARFIQGIIKNKNLSNMPFVPVYKGGESGAEALRRTLLGLIDGPGFRDSKGRSVFSYAHPLFWAPFSLIGDGGGNTAGS